MADLLTNALHIVGAHRLSVFELARFLLREEYREALLRQPVEPADPYAYYEARSYCEEEFRAWSRSERAAAVSPVMNKIREILRSPALRAILCSRRNTLDLASLWHKPGLVLVRLDQPALGELGMRLLAGLLTHLLFRTALRTGRDAPVPVVLALDELPVLERFVGGVIADIVTVARSQKLRCLVACQHLEQVSDRLRTTLLANAALQAFMRLGYGDARLVATSLAAGVEPRLSRLVLGVDRVDRETGEPETAQWSHPVFDPYGQRLRRNRRDWRSATNTLDQVLWEARCDGVGRLYIHDPISGEPREVREYVKGLPEEACAIEGREMQLVVAFPRPRISGVERLGESEVARNWIRTLQELPVQHAVVRLAGQPAGVIRVADVPDPRVSGHRRLRYLARSIEANGQSAAEVEATLRDRQEQVERLAGGRVAQPGKEGDDGSLL